MNFQWTWKRIMNGSKDATRRIVYDGERFVLANGDTHDVSDYDAVRVEHDMLGLAHLDIRVVYGVAGNRRWHVGNTYAVQSGRTKPAIWIAPDGRYTDDIEATYLDMTENWGGKGLAGAKRWALKHGYREARIRLTAIHLERLQDMTEDDAIAEGFAPHDVSYSVFRKPARMVFKDAWNGIHTRKSTRWDDNPLVWVLTFELVRE